MIALWLLSAACALGYWGRVTADPGPVRSILKTASVAGLALIAALSGFPVLAIALVSCACGDWFLSRGSEHSFLNGVVAFAVGHMAFVALFLVQLNSDLRALAAFPQIAGVIGLILLGTLMAWLILPRAGPLRGPVAIYILVILSMGLAALSLSGGMATLVILAAALFILSDCILAVEQFLQPEEAPVTVLSYLVWPIYWTAQALFLFAFVGMPSL